MVAGAIAGNISAEATAPTGNTFVEAMRAMRLEHIDAGLQDFDEIADFVLNQCAPGTIVREKAPGRKWVQRIA
jgi:hypothetical protein